MDEITCAEEKNVDLCSMVPIRNQLSGIVHGEFTVQGPSDERCRDLCGAVFVGAAAIAAFLGYKAAEWVKRISHAHIGYCVRYFIQKWELGDIISGGWLAPFEMMIWYTFSRQSRSPSDVRGFLKLL